MIHNSWGRLSNHRQMAEGALFLAGQQSEFVKAGRTAAHDPASNSCTVKKILRTKSPRETRPAPRASARVCSAASTLLHSDPRIAHKKQNIRRKIAHDQEHRGQHHYSDYNIGVA